MLELFFFFWLEKIYLGNNLNRWLTMYIYEKRGSALKVIIYVTLAGIIVFLSTYIFYLEKVEGENISNKDVFNKTLSIPTNILGSFSRIFVL